MKKSEATAKRKKRALKKYNVTLNFVLKFNDCEACVWDSPPSAAKRTVFRLTDEHFRTNDFIKHVKTFDAFGMVEYFPYCFTDYKGEICSAVWDDEEFAIHMVIETPMNINELRRQLKTIPLEDGEYEAHDDNGWTIKTIGKDEDGNKWEYGTIDYRGNPILIRTVARD